MPPFFRRGAQKPLPGAQLDPEHPFAHDLIAALLFHANSAPTAGAGLANGPPAIQGGAAVGVLKPLGLSFDLATTPDWRSNREGSALYIPATRKTRLYGAYLLSSDAWLPATNVTVCLIRRKTDTTLRDGVAFSHDSFTMAEACRAFLPYSDGIAYWDFGGNSGSNRITASGLAWTTTPERWVLTAGARGMAMWRDGIKVASSATAVTRTTGTGGFILNGWTANAGDEQEFNYFAIYACQWSNDLCRAWSAEPYAHFYPPLRRRVFFDVADLSVPVEVTFDNAQVTIGETWWELTTPSNAQPPPYTDRPLPDPSTYYRGWKEPRVRRWGRIQRSLSGFDGQYESATFEMSHVDTDRALRAFDADDDLVDGAGVVRMITDEGRRALDIPRVVYRGLVKDIGPEPDLAYKVTLKDPFVDAFQVTGNAPTIPSRRVVDDDFPNCGVTVVASSATGYQTSASAIVGADTVSIDTGTGLFASGDRFTFAGHATIYTASTGYATTSLSFTPPLTDPVGDNEAITVLASHIIESARGKCVPIVYGHITDHTIIDSIDVGDGQGPVIYVGDRTIGGDVWAEFLWAGHACYSPSGKPIQHLYFWNHNLDDLASGTFYKDGIELTDLNLQDLATEADSGGRLAVPGFANWSDLGFTDSYIDYNGRRYTVLYLRGVYRDWALGLLDPPDNLGGVPFSIDAYGCEDIGDGTGALIANGLLQYLHTIVNWCPPQGDSYQSGAWLSVPTYPDSTPMIDAASFAAADALSGTYVDDGFRGDFILGAGNDGIAPRDLIARFNQSFGVDAGFNRHTQFVVNLINRDLGSTTLAPALGWERDIFSGQFAIESRTRELYPAIRYRHTPDYLGRTSDGWRLIAAGSSPDLEMFMVRGKNRDTDPDEYTRGSDTAAAVVALKLARYSVVQHIATLQTGPAGFNYDVGDVVPITHYAGVGAEGWTEVPCRIERLEIDPTSYTTTLELYDLRPLLID